MTLLEVLGMGTPHALALQPWGEAELKYLAIGPNPDTHVASVLFDPVSNQVQALELFDEEGLTFVWHDPEFTHRFPGTPIDEPQALNSLAYLMRATNDPT